MNQHEIVLYKMEDANVCVSVYYENETFWLTTKAMAELLGSKHKLLQSIWAISMKKKN